MRTIEVECIFDAEGNDKLRELGLESSSEETGLVTLVIKHISNFYATTNPNRIRVNLTDGTFHLVNMSYENFKELFYSAKQKEQII